jgi:YD repeat-containing protein
MSDRATWQVTGPVRSVTSEIAEWSPKADAWRAARSRGSATFHRDGRVDECSTVNPDGSLVRDGYLYQGDRLLEVQFFRNGTLVSRTVHVYDGRQRLIRVSYVAADGTEGDVQEFSYADDRKRSVRRTDARTRDAMHAIEGCDICYGAPGTATIETAYDDNGLPVDVVMRGGDGQQLRRLILTRDAGGKVLTEQFQMASPVPPDMAHIFASMPPEERESAMAALSAIFTPDMTFRSQSNGYDASGRLIERRATMGQLGDERTTWQYDDRGNRVAETREETSHEVRIAEEGALEATSESRQAQQHRFDYVYDAHGNWTEKVAWTRLDESSPFQRSSIERRVITYFDA